MKRWVRCGLLLLGLPATRAWLESRMSLHMAIELPLLMLSGWTFGGVAPGRWKLLERIDAGGLLCATIAACILTLWMVPAALDMAVMEPGIALLKYGQWIVAGVLLRNARNWHSPVVAAFFLANAAWMTVTAGLLYLDAEQQLCVNYLVDDQRVAGFALLAWGVALGVLAGGALQPVLAQGVDT
ncbi:MAG: hypothetical protein HY020_00785 [Burkholderiales bacterium]|nr:hypothetical protein [Burkholderiales bacterium]